MKFSFVIVLLSTCIFLLPHISFVRNARSFAEGKLIKYFDIRPPLSCKEYVLLFICIMHKDLDISSVASPKNKLFCLHHKTGK